MPALGSLDAWLCEKHAGRACDLLTSGAHLDEADVHGLLRPSASADFVEKMSWDQAVVSAGAIVHDSPHPYPNDSDVIERFSLPGAERIHVAFHPDTVTEARYDHLTVTWTTHPNAQGQIMRYRAGPFSGTQARGWPGGRNPPLVIDSDAFAIPS